MSFNKLSTLYSLSCTSTNSCSRTDKLGDVGIISSLGIIVDFIALLISIFPQIIEYKSLSLSLCLTPNPVLALPCGSESIINVFLSQAAMAVAKLTTVVVLPTPPFWLATAII